MKLATRIKLATIILVVCSLSILAQNVHVHHVHSLQQFAAKILDVKNGEVFFQDLEENEIGVVMVKHAQVDKEFRVLEVKMDNNSDGNIKILGLGALEHSSGILSVCKDCGKIGRAHV